MHPRHSGKTVIDRKRTAAALGCSGPWLVEIFKQIISNCMQHPARTRGAQCAPPTGYLGHPSSPGRSSCAPPRRGDPCGRPHLCRYLVHFCTSVYFFDRRRTAAAPGCTGPFLLHFFATRDVVCNGRVLSGWFQGEHRQRGQKQYACRHRYPGQPVFLHQRAVFLPVLGLDCRPYPSAAVPQHPCRRGRQYQTVYHRLLPFFRQRQSVQIAPPPLPV